MAAAADNSLDSTYLYQQLDAYPWDTDQEFQGGLRAILGSVQDPAQVEHLTLRARCFYFARKAGTSVDFDGYKGWVESGGGSVHDNGLHEGNEYESSTDKQIKQEGHEGEGSGGMGDAPKPASFAEICDMIAEGKPIPGIKDIPDTVLEGQKSESQTEKRQKPWERKATSGEQPSWMQ